MSGKGQIKLLTDEDFVTYLKAKEREPVSCPSHSPTPDSLFQESKTLQADHLLKQESDEQITRHLRKLQLVNVKGRLCPDSKLSQKKFTSDGLKKSIDRLYWNPLLSKKCCFHKPKAKVLPSSKKTPANQVPKVQVSVPSLEIKTDASLSTTAFSKPSFSIDRLRASSTTGLTKHLSIDECQRLDCSGNTLTQTSPNWLTASLSSYLKNSPKPQSSPSALSSSHILPTGSKSPVKRRKRQFHVEIGRLVSAHGQIFEEHALKKAKKKHKMLRDLNNLCAEEGSTTKWGDFVGVVYSPRKGTEVLPESLEELEKLKALNERMFKTMGQAPAELYRIISRPNFLNEKLKSPTSLIKNDYWTEEHEAAYKALVRKSHPKNPIVKTMRFRATEKALPAEKHLLNTEWKYDKRSPWVNDLDYHDKNYLTADDADKTKRKPISNIKTAIRDESPEIDEEELKVQELLMKTGLTEAKNMYSLQELAQQIDRVNDYEDAVKCFVHVKSWKNSKKKVGDAKLKLADHIVAEKQVDSKELSRARYSYLSSKIASQRANTELHEKLLNVAEDKRVELRKRQEEFQHFLTPMRAVVRRMYGNCYMHKGRRALKLTSYGKNHPMFIPTMVKLGYLPPTIEAKPERQRPGTVIIAKKEDPPISPHSSKNLSKLNFPSHSYKEKPKPEQSTKKAGSVLKIQRFVRGYLARIRLTRMKTAVVKLQYLAKRRYSRKILYGCIVKAVQTGRYFRVTRLVARHRYYNLFIKVVKERLGSIEAFNRLISKQDRGSTREHSRRSVNRNANLKHSRRESDLSPTSAKLSYSSSMPISIVSGKLKSKANAMPKPSHDLTEQEKLELVGIANQINGLIGEIRRHRAEMWSYYLSSVSNAHFTDQELTNLLARSSLYVTKTGESRAWEDTQLMLPFLDSRNVTPEDVKTIQAAEVLVLLSSELKKSIESKEEAKAKYKRRAVAWESLAELELPGDLPTPSQRKNFEALIHFDGSPVKQILG